MKSVLNLFIGVAMTAVMACINPAIVGEKFLTNIGIELLGASSEFIGDGTQGFVGAVRERFNKSIASKKVIRYIESNDKIIDIILEDIRKSTIAYKSVSKRKLKRIEKRERNDKSRDKLNVQTLIKLNIEVLYNTDFRAYLVKSSPKFKEINEEQKEVADGIVDVISAALDIYTREMFCKMDDYNLQLTTQIIVKSIKDYIPNILERQFDKSVEKFEEYIKDVLLPYITFQNGGKFNFQEIVLAKYSPKYILNSCPECGYRGPRIYTNEKTNITHCAACGSSYSILKYCEPELWQEINDKIGAINKNSNELKVLVGSGNEQIKNLAKDLDATKEQLLDGLEQVVTKEYLNVCMNNNAELMSSVKIDIEKSYKEYSAQINNLSKQNNDILKAIMEINEQNKKSNEFLSSKLNSLEAQLSKIYDFARHEFEGMGVKSDLILQYVQKLCSKEYFEEMSNALGTNMTRAINYNTEEIVALNTASVAQILEAISDLKERGNSLKAEGEKDGEGEVFSASFERLICDQTAQLSGQVNGLQELIKNNHAEYSNAFRAIINSQDEIKAILLSKISISTNTHAFEKMYSGKIPDRYLYNEGFGGAFPCPYCGAEEERIINDEQYCRCSICGQKFLAVDLSQNIKNVDPFYRAEDSEEQTILNIIASKYGRNRNDPLLATEERIKKWLEYHSADITINKQDNTFVLKNPTSYGRRDIRSLTMDGFSKDKEPLLIIPYIKEFNNKIIHGNNYEFEVGTTFKDISILVFMYGIEYVDADMLRKFRAVNKIIFMPKKSANSGKYEYTFRTDADSAQGQNIHSSSRNRLFVPQGRDINVFGKSSGGQPIIVEKQ